MLFGGAPPLTPTPVPKEAKVSVYKDVRKKGGRQLTERRKQMCWHEGQDGCDNCPLTVSLAFLAAVGKMGTRCPLQRGL